MDFKQRLEVEQKELQEKIDKLGAFIGTEVYEGLANADKRILVLQKKAMETYNNILKIRLEGNE